jgi:hypothetical protein
MATNAQTLIDVWDVETFDPELAGFLDRNRELIRDYRIEDRRLFDEREKQTLRGPPEQNIHGPAYAALKDDAGALMLGRTIRAWHFTRLTSAERMDILANGMGLMSLPVIMRRLDLQVEAGAMDRATAQRLYAASPFHHQIDGNRDGKIWLTAQPYPLDHSSVTGLVERWGGESVNFDHQDSVFSELLKSIGEPSVIEVALPLAITTRAGCAGVNVIDAYAASMGVSGGWGGGADMVAIEPITPEMIRKIHVAGDAEFATMGRGFPPRFILDE